MEYLIGKDGNSLKKLTQIKNIKLIILAGQAKPTPPVGPALGQYGVNLMDFCKQFNDLTKAFKTTIPISTEIRINPDKTFKINIKAPSNTYFLKIAANQNQNQPKGRGFSGDVAGRVVTLKQIYEIAIIRTLAIAFTRQGPQGLNIPHINDTSLLTPSPVLVKTVMEHLYKSPNGSADPAASGILKNICKNIIGSAQSLKFKIISDL